jgi:hypothetical protein
MATKYHYDDKDIENIVRKFNPNIQLPNKFTPNDNLSLDDFDIQNIDIT